MRYIPFLALGLIPLGYFLFFTPKTQPSSDVHAQHHQHLSPVISSAIRELPPPVKYTGIGKSHWPIPTNPTSQAWFDQGINMLHAFWYVEAYRAFTAALKADPNNLMAYWGVAMSMPGVISEGHSERTTAIQKAYEEREKLPQKEQLFIELTFELVTGQHALALQKAEALYSKFSNDAEVVALVGYLLIFGNEAQNHLSRQILEKGLSDFPDHVGIIHYYIHLIEIKPDFEKAIPYAERLLVLAPNAAHLVHMPGHLYYKQGKYKEASAIYAKAYEVDRLYHNTQKVPFIDNTNYLHNLHYWAVSLAEANHLVEAKSIADRYANVIIKEGRESASGSYMVDYEGRMLPSLVYIRARQWKQAHQTIQHLLDTLAPDPQSHLARYIEAISFFTEGMNALDLNQQEKAQNAMSEMAARGASLLEVMKAKEGTAEYERLLRGMQLLQVMLLELKSWLINQEVQQPLKQSHFDQAFAWENQIGYQEPPRLLYPVAESLGYLHLKRKEWAAARQAFERALKIRPESGWILKGLLQVEEQIGTPATVQALKRRLEATFG